MLAINTWAEQKCTTGTFVKGGVIMDRRGGVER